MSGLRGPRLESPRRRCLSSVSRRNSGERGQGCIERCELLGEVVSHLTAVVARASPRASRRVELRAVTLLAITTCGFPTAIAGQRWVDEVLAREAAVE